MNLGSKKNPVWTSMWTSKKAGHLDPPNYLTLRMGATGIEPMTSTVSR